MDCLICYKIFIPEIELESIEETPTQIAPKYAATMSGVLNVPNTAALATVFAQSVTCLKCHKRFEKADRLLAELAEIQNRIGKIRTDIESELEQSKKVAEVMGQGLRSWGARCRLFDELNRSRDVTDRGSGWSERSDSFSIEVRVPYEDGHDHEQSGGAPEEAPGGGGDLEEHQNDHEMEAGDVVDGPQIHQVHGSDLYPPIVIKVEPAEGAVTSSSDVDRPGEVPEVPQPPEDDEKMDEGVPEGEVYNMDISVNPEHLISDDFDGADAETESDDEDPASPEAPEAPEGKIEATFDPKSHPAFSKCIPLRIVLEPLPRVVRPPFICNVDLEPISSFVARDRKRVRMYQKTRNFTPMSMLKPKRGRKVVIVDEGELKFTCGLEDCGFRSKTEKGIGVHQIAKHGKVKQLSNAEVEERISKMSQKELEKYGIAETPSEFTGASPGHNFANPEGDSEQIEEKAKVRRRRKPTGFSVLRFNCRICKKKLANKATYDRHMLTHRATASKNKCSVCSESFSSANALVVHWRTHALKLSCEDCGKKFAREQWLLQHRFLPSDIEAKVHQCTACVKVFTRESCLKFHVVEAHEDRLHICEYCTKSFKWKQNLLKHTSCILKDGEGEECSFCSEKFAGKYCLRHHIEITHPSELTCKTCGLKTGGLTALKIHRRTHSSLRSGPVSRERIGPLTCRFCLVEYPSSGELEAHQSSSHQSERPYECIQCGKGFKQLFLLKYHTSTHTGIKPYGCRHCEDHFGNPMNRHIHEIRKHGVGSRGKSSLKKNSGPSSIGRLPRKHNFQCKACTKTFGFAQNYNKHLGFIVEGSEVKCGSCEAVFESFSCLRAHGVIAHDVISKKGPRTASSATLERKCKFCLTEFPTHDDLVAHLESNHKDTDRPYICTHCSSTFKDAPSLRRHAMIHSDVKSFICDKTGCGSSFISKERLKMHQLQAHPEDFPIICEFCRNRYANQLELNKHLGIYHKTDRAYRCGIRNCSEKFEGAAERDAHEGGHAKRRKRGPKRSGGGRKGAGRPIGSGGGRESLKCRHCDRVFGSERLRKDHETLHTGERPYTCPLQSCRKKFRTSGQLQNHSTTHGKRNFPCDLCEKKFRTNALLFIHRNYHTKEKEYRCKYEGCTRVFYGSSNLWTHQAKHKAGMKALTTPLIRGPKVLRPEAPKRELPKRGSKRKFVESSSESSDSETEYVKPKNVFTCGVCGFQFGRIETLQRHMEFCS